LLSILLASELFWVLLRFMLLAFITGF